MIYKVFAVLDKKIAAYNQPMFFRSRGEAIRAFTDAVQDEKQGFSRHAEDYVWCYLGEYEDSTGRFTGAVHGPEPVIAALDCVAARDPQLGVLAGAG